MVNQEGALSEKRENEENERKFKTSISLRSNDCKKLANYDRIRSWSKKIYSLAFRNPEIKELKELRRPLTITMPSFQIQKVTLQ